MLFFDYFAARRIFGSVKQYCDEKGLLKNLESHLTAPEKDRFDSDRTTKEGLYVLDAVHCVIDKKRTLYFLKDILSEIGPKDSVLEAGIGTGILSFAAALKAKKVVGIEINRSTFDLANDIKSDLQKKSYFAAPMKKIEFFHADATRFVHDDKFSVVISENIYTGMFYEKQVQIVNSLRDYLAPGYIAIPNRMISFVSLSETNFPNGTYSDKELFVPLEHENTLSYKLLSKKVPYNDLDFTKKTNEKILFSGDITINEDSTINSIFISSEVHLPSKAVIEGKETIFFNNDIIVGCKPSIEARKGDIISVNIAYRAGDNPHDMKLELIKN